MKAAIASTLTVAMWLSAGVSAVQARALQPIYIKNQCSKTITLMIQHADKYRNWHPHGWYKFSPFESAYLKANNVRLRQLSDHELYMYARTSTGGELSGSHWVNFEGGTYGAKKVTKNFRNGRIEINLTCD